ncbi:MAG: hypothetical protein J6O49_13645, partial [Bacteroidaceae bacterium]|nr:hypothetical protein [Bacteroidaceae bacterium]
NLQDLLDAGVPNKKVQRDEVGGYWEDERLEDESIESLDLTFTLIFNHCTIGGEDLIADKVKFKKLWNLGPDNIKFKFIINGENYKAKSNWYAEGDSRNGTITLEPEQSGE